MKNIAFFLLAVLLFSAFISKGQDEKKAFCGMWTLDIEEGRAVGWLHVNEDKGYLDAELLWRGGSVVPVAHVYYGGDKILVVTQTNEIRISKKGDPERKQVVTQTYRITRNGDNLEGVHVSPARDGMSETITRFKGWRLPDPPVAPDLAKVKYGKPIVLFNGKNLSGWKLIDPNQTNGFKVIDGVLVNNPEKVEGKYFSYGNIRTEKEFEDFNLKLEVSIPEHSNSGIYLRGIYEIQVLDSYGKKLNRHNMGAVYSRITPTVAAEKPAGEWQSFDITLCDRHITVILNGTKIIDNQAVHGPTGGAIIADVFKPGPIYLQGDHGKVSYRNIVLTPIVK